MSRKAALKALKRQQRKARHPYRLPTNPYAGEQELLADKALVEQACQAQYGGSLKGLIPPMIIMIDERPVVAPWIITLRALMIEKYGFESLVQPRLRFLLLDWAQGSLGGSGDAIIVLDTLLSEAGI